MSSRKLNAKKYNIARLTRTKESILSSKPVAWSEKVEVRPEIVEAPAPKLRAKKSTK
jgi:hypothetical protein